MSDYNDKAVKQFVAAIREVLPAEVANVLRNRPGMLVEATIEVDESTPGSEWDWLKECLCQASMEDALIIFDAMAKQLKGRSYADCSEVMRTALSSPQWSIQAIESHPDLFRCVRRDDEALSSQVEKRASNALQILASVGLPYSSYELMRSVIVALKAIGVTNDLNPKTHERCLHWAAISLEPEAFRAFLDEFPDSLDASTTDGWRPLHNAAHFGHPLNVKMLLERGADPCPKNRFSCTPLRYVDCKKRLESAMFLIDTGAYSDDDFKEAMRHQGSSLGDQVTRLRDFHAAVKAREAINRVDSQPMQLPSLEN